MEESWHFTLVWDAGFLLSHWFCQVSLAEALRKLLPVFCTLWPYGLTKYHCVVKRVEREQIEGSCRTSWTNWPLDTKSMLGFVHCFVVVVFFVFSSPQYPPAATTHTHTRTCTHTLTHPDIHTHTHTHTHTPPDTYSLSERNQTLSGKINACIRSDTCMAHDLGHFYQCWDPEHFAVRLMVMWPLHLLCRINCCGTRGHYEGQGIYSLYSSSPLPLWDLRPAVLTLQSISYQHHISNSPKI